MPWGQPPFIKFEVGGVYDGIVGGTTLRNVDIVEDWDEPVKVTRISDKMLWFQSGCSTAQVLRTKIHKSDHDDDCVLYEPKCAGPLKSGGVCIEAGSLHCLHPFFPSKPHGSLALHKKIMKTFVLFFFSVKLIVIARRVKERMYTPGGIGFIAAQDDFDRVTKSQRIE